MSSNYWSSTTNANNTNNAWNVNFNNGNVNNNNKSNSYYVRAVRAGKCSLLSWSSVYQAYLECRRRKRGTINALRFEVDLLDNLFDLALEMQKGTYQPSRSVCFVTTRPKNREIFAADFRDRVVHHLVVRELEKILEPQLIHDSYASRSGKGIHVAVERLQGFMLKATCNQKRAAWFLQLDIRSFFMSIDKDILFGLFERQLGHGDSGRYPHADIEALLYLLHRIIYHDCTQDYVFKGNPAMLGQIPAHKTLFKIAVGKGLPIGNLTSQFFANVYLNELDQFVKHRLNCRYYLRYVDDTVFVSDDREQLASWKEQIEQFLAERLGLSLKDGGLIRRVADGVDFLGYIVRPGYKLARKRVVNNLKSKLADFKGKMVRRQQFGRRPVVVYNMDPEMVQALQQVLSSYLGHFKHANTWNLVTGLFARHDWLQEYFFLDNGKILDRFRHKGVFHTLRGQVNFFKARLGASLCFVRVGKYYELYGADARLMAGALKLNMREKCRRMACGIGFPAGRFRDYLSSALALGHDVAVIEQGESRGAYVCERYVRKLYKSVIQ